MPKDKQIKDYPAGYPTWVDKIYFNDILRKHYDLFKVVHFNVGTLNEKGENYVSSLFRVKVTLEKLSGLAQRSFIVKASLQSSLPPEIEELFNVFPKEIEMYTAILPAFVSLFRDIGETVRFGPACFVGTSNPADLIIMDDLGQEGFKSADRMVGLDFDHIRLTLAKLAQMHAASAVFIQKGNVFAEKYDYGIYSEAMRPIMKPMFQRFHQIQRECMVKWKCADILEKYMGNWENLMIDRLFETVKRNDARFNVLCHGDLWCNNVLFRYHKDTGKVEECLLVDYQMCNYNTPMLDLQYFIYSSTQHDIKMNKVDHILHFYHQELVANLKKLGYSKQPPTLLQLQKDFLDVGNFGVVTSFGTLCTALAPPGDDAEVGNFFRNDEVGDNFKRRLYSNPVYVRAIEDLVPFFEMKGLLDG